LGIPSRPFDLSSIGDGIRDWSQNSEEAFWLLSSTRWTYSCASILHCLTLRSDTCGLSNAADLKATFSSERRSLERRGLSWQEYQELYVEKTNRTTTTITFAFVATHNHFVLDRGGKVFKQHRAGDQAAGLPRRRCSTLRVAQMLSATSWEDRYATEAITWRCWGR
jgi:hypothetical protein